MVRVTEGKFECREPRLLEAILRRVGAVLVGDTLQADTHFRAPDRRLLRRTRPGLDPTWLLYRRGVWRGVQVTESALLTERDALRLFGSRGSPVWVVTHKTRRTWRHDGLRVHIDEVGGLGAFVEIQRRTAQGESRADARRRVLRARQALAIALGESVSCGYADLAAHEQAWTMDARALPPGPA